MGRAVKPAGLTCRKKEGLLAIAVRNYNYQEINCLKMANFLIEIPHSENSFECKQVIKLFLESGSHLLTNAHWGCKAGVHKSWFISEFDSKEEALRIVPPYLRHAAQVVELTTFSKQDFE